MMCLGKKFLSSIEFLEEKINKWTAFIQRNSSSLISPLNDDDVADKVS